MEFKIKVRNMKTMKEWWEEYDEDTQNAEEWAIKTIKWFNDTLHPHEAPRKLLEVEVIEEGNDKHHKWEKHTAGMSVSFRGSTVDIMYCKKCGITGKRFGLTGIVKIDSKFRKKAYRECHTAKLEREKEPWKK